MSREISEIISHIRTACDNPNIKTTLIQTEDLLALCEAAELPAGGAAVGPVTKASSFVLSALEKKDWKAQSFEYYAAHFLVGTGLVGGNLDGNVRALAAALKHQYDIGVEHSKKIEAETP